MKTFCFLPLAYLAGIHGFALFAPYAAVFLTAAHVIKGIRRGSAERMPAVVPA